jgi:nicotinamide-nucleotide amidase
MQAELVMVGTELLLGEVLDTNAQWLAAKLAEIGVHLYFKSTVGARSFVLLSLHFAPVIRVARR